MSDKTPQISIHYLGVPPYHRPSRNRTNSLSRSRQSISSKRSCPPLLNDFDDFRRSQAHIQINPIATINDEPIRRKSLTIDIGPSLIDEQSDSPPVQPRFTYLRMSSQRALRTLLPSSNIFDPGVMRR
jgi:hypothetical protein